MTDLGEVFTPPASASYAQVEAYETGRKLGATDRRIGAPYKPIHTRWQTYEFAGAYTQGYEAGWAETVPDDR